MPTPKQHSLRRLARMVRLPGVAPGVLRRLDADVRELALFSAGVTQARFLSQLRRVLIGIERGDLTRAEAKRHLRRWLANTGYEPPAGQEGKIQDLSSDIRLRVIVETQAGLSEGYGRYMWQRHHQKQFPYVELYRREPRRHPRDWPKIWKVAGGKQYAGRFIAPFGSPIWLRISDFGHPYPVFKWLSGMWTRMVSSYRAAKYGLQGAAKRARLPRMLEGCKSGMKGIDRELGRVVTSALPGWRLDRDAIVWRGSWPTS